MERARGLTLIELLCVLALAGLLLSAGYPAMQSLLRDAQLSGLVGTYLHAFNSARYAAVARQRHVSLCTLDTRGNCTGRWAGDLTLFYDDDRDGRLRVAADVIEKVAYRAPDKVNVTFRAFRTTRYVNLRSSGHYRQNGTFRFCPQGNDAGRAIVINVTGRARSEKTSCPH